MRKRLTTFAMIFGLIFTLAACGNYDITDSELNTSQTAEENPFSQAEGDGALGAIRHVETNPNRAENQSVLPYEYNGGEFTLEYQFATEGKLDNIGFLLFLDGKPQVYKINDTDAEYEYFHCFQTEDKHEENFSFIFTPNTGKKGDTLNITIISLTNPDFQPDMKETTSYGWYHKPLERVLQLHFNEDAPDYGGTYVQNYNIFSDVGVTEQKVTSDYIENELIRNGWNGVTMDTLDNGVYSTISYDGELIYDNLCVSNKDTVTVRYTICGTAGMECGVSFFLNHTPIAMDDMLSCNITLTKGNVVVIEATIDTSKLEDFHTFYAVAVGASADYEMPANKTESILFYKED